MCRNKDKKIILAFEWAALICLVLFAGYVSSVVMRNVIRERRSEAPGQGHHLCFGSFLRPGSFFCFRRSHGNQPQASLARSKSYSAISIPEEKETRIAGIWEVGSRQICSVCIR